MLWRLILLVIAIAVPLLGFDLVHQYLEYRDAVAATGRQTLLLARSMALQVDEELQSRIGTLQTLAGSQALAAGDLVEFRTRAEAVVAEQFPGANIILLKADGQQVLNTILPPGTPLPIRKNMESTRQVFATGRPAVSNVYEGAVGPRPVVAIDVPVKGRDGAVVYVLSLNPRLAVFAEAIRRQQPPSSWVIGVLDRRAVLVARIPDGGFIGHQAAASTAFQAQRDGIVESTSLEGIPLLTVFSHAERYGWAVAIGVPQAELTGPAFAAAMRTLAAGTALLAIGLALALFVARRITGPIESLRRFAAATERDALPPPMATGLREIDEVAQALRTAEEERRVSRQAEAVFRDGIESMPEGFAIYDDADRLVVCNQSYRNLCAGPDDLVVPGVSFEEILRAGLATKPLPDAKGREEEWLAERLQSERILPSAIEQPLPDGRWLFITKRRMANGFVAALLVDITSLKAAEQALRAREEQFRRVVEAVPNAIVMIDADGRIALLNAQAERAFGYSRTELFGQPVEVLLPERYRDRHPDLREAFFTDPQSRPMGAGRDLFARRKDGREFPVEIGLSPIETETGTMVISAIIDISGRKQAEQRLIDAQRLAHMGSIVRNLASDQADWSDEAYRIFGVSRETFVPTTANFMGMVHVEDRAAVGAALEQMRQGICPKPFEFRIIRPDGTVRHIYRETELIGDEAGNLIVAGTIQDITERRQTEQQLRQAQKMEAIGNLTGGMAHDFNNLLGVIVGNLDLARGRIGSDEELRELVVESLEAAWRGADLTRRLLAFARRQPLRPSRIEVNDLIADTTRLLGRLLGEDIEISLSLPEGIWPVTADPAQLEASLANLATNARDAMPNGGRLTIATANRQLDADYAASHADVTPGDFVMIEVSDSGIGMSADIANQIFEPFFTTKEVGKGTGLGLSMVFGFLRQSGGHVTVYSEPGIGTTFRLYLPRAVEDAAAADAPAAPVAVRGAGETVLIVEDNPAVRRTVLRQLRALGYRVLECERAVAALDILAREPVDLLLTDIVMPGGLDGVELARLARERWPALKIVLTSGFPEARTNGNGAIPEGLQLLSKPYSTEELAAMLRAVLGA